MNKVELDQIIFGDNALPFIGGPCVIESRDHCFRMAEKIAEITSNLNVPFIFKSSFLRFEQIRTRHLATFFVICIG